MSIYRLRRGTPCEVRRPGADWRAHTASETTEFRFCDRVSYDASPHWVFAKGGWEVRVRVPALECTHFDELANEPWRIGITGTREGLTREQRDALADHLRRWLLFSIQGVPEFHHGGATGADRHAHNVVREVYGVTARVVVHPASDLPEPPTDWTDADELRPAYPALVRNRRIVDATAGNGMLLAFPRTRREEQRSGTWDTVRAARRRNLAVLYFWPDATEPDGQSGSDKSRHY